MPVAGNSWRITRAASKPSVVLVGGIRISTTTSSGTSWRTSASSCAPPPARPTTAKPDRSSRLARPSRKRMSSSARTTRNLLMAETSPSRAEPSCAACPSIDMTRIIALATHREHLLDLSPPGRAALPGYECNLRGPLGIPASR